MSILEQIRQAGVVGCGGAGFPTHLKLKAGVEYLIVNGAECEPLLRTDRYIMLHHAPQLVKAILALKEELSISRCVIAVKAHYRQEIEALEQAIGSSPVELHQLGSFYPAGDEQTIVHEVTGRVVPPGGLPLAAGAVVDNIATIYAISQAMEGIPFTQKILTVTGEVAHPVVLSVPVGTSFRACLELAGGPLTDRYCVVSGGPMMGRTLTKEEAEEAFVTKTTSGILVLPEEGPQGRARAVDLTRMLSRASSACIQCTSCTQLCPRHMLGHPLQPHRIMRKMAMTRDPSTLLQDPDILNARLCCECGVCELYACPMGLFPRKINALLKQELAQAGVPAQSYAQTGWEPRPEREARKVPSEKAAARAGVRRYYHLEIREMRTAQPDTVEIPLKMHIGAPCLPLVAPGDSVRAGQLIAQPPEGAMGALIHASMDGRVTRVDERIAITKE